MEKWPFISVTVAIPFFLYSSLIEGINSIFPRRGRKTRTLIRLASIL
jgi:hypothetical protein